MSIVINNVPVSPERVYPRPWGAISLWLQPTPDEHIWQDVTSGAGPTQYQPPACLLPGQEYDWRMCLPEQKPAPQKAVRPVVSTAPNWFTLAAFSSTHSCVDLEQLATDSIQANVELAGVEEAVSEALTTAVPTPTTTGCLSEALSKAVQVAATSLYGNGLIHISPATYAQVSLETPAYFNTVGGKLYDQLQNLYHVSPAQPPNTIFVEEGARYAVYLSPIEILNGTDALDAQRDRNELQVRATAGFLLLSDRCFVQGFSFPNCVAD